MHELLAQAVNGGNVEKVRSALKGGLFKSKPSRMEIEEVFWQRALQHQGHMHLDIIKCFVEEGDIFLKGTDKDSNTPVMIMARGYYCSSTAPVIEYLINKGVRVYDENKAGDTALSLAIKQSEYTPYTVNVVKTLVKAKARVIPLKDSTKPLLHLVVLARGRSIDTTVKTDILRCLVEEAGADVTEKDDHGTCLIFAARAGDLLAVKYLLDECKMDKNERASRGYTPLLSAAQCGAWSVVRYLIDEKKCDIEVRNHNKDTLFDLAYFQHSYNDKNYYNSVNPAIRKEGDETIKYLKSLEAQIQAREKQAKETAAKKEKPVAAADVVSDSLAKMTISLEIPYTDLKIDSQNPLGQGGFGIVYPATWQGASVAVKALAGHQFSDDVLGEFKREASIMAKLRHPHIIQFYGICTKPYCIVMERASKGSLTAVLQNHAEMNWPLRLKIALGAVKGISFLHAQTPTILHRDIKSANLLLDEALNPKWTDFGLAKVKDTAQSTSSKMGGNVAGTLAWMAPELLSGDSNKHTPECDVYSLAIVLWEIASGLLPYHNKTAKEIFAAVVLRNERENIPADCPPKFAALIADGWQEKVNERINIKKMLQKLEEIEGANTVLQQSNYMSFS